MENPYRVLEQEPPKQNDFKIRFYELFFLIVISSSIDRYLYDVNYDYVEAKVFFCWVIGIFLFCFRK